MEGCSGVLRGVLFSGPEAPDLTHFLSIMRAKCFNTRELVKEDLLCHFRFSRKGVELVGDLGDRMGKVEMMKSLKERKADPKVISSSRHPGDKKRKASMGEGPRLARFYASSVPDKNFDLVRRTPELKVIEAASLRFMQNSTLLVSRRLDPTNFTRKLALQRLIDFGLLIQSTTGISILSAVCTRKPKKISRTESPRRNSRNKFRLRRQATSATGGGLGGEERKGEIFKLRSFGITDSACKNQSVMVSVQYGPFNTNIPIRSTTIGKSRVARDPTTMHTSWRSNSDIACVTRANGYSGYEHPALFLDVEQSLVDMPEEDEGFEEGSSGPEGAPSPPPPPS
ncbi:ETHYLENE INSENSITIVE 3-like 4 protein [Dorcoceras hygrometricum]|uniref:ETHYLENE INSENSITIVE 3-like 4 protein n=1 Tax=Dorcoceras hygrometricum TaxID=472368 RepID=A0A2Z7AI29_9LAMI|nr:ETHYLENE INSENSITIVE 3-like 4 protein [Dorcoceras hygrometricum]